MFFHHQPNCGNGTNPGWAQWRGPGFAHQQRPNFAGQFGPYPFTPENIRAGLATAAAAANAFTEPWVSAFMANLNKPESTGCNNTENIDSVSNTDEKFEVKVDVTNFSPDQINVKVVDNSLVIEVKHEEKEDNYGLISRQFVRRFILLEGVMLEQMNCKMISNNIIVISAPRHVEKPTTTNERSIPIHFTGQPETNKESSSENVQHS